MGLLDVHADGIAQARAFQARNPEPDQPPPSFNLWSFGAAGIKSPAVGGFELGSTLADFAKIYQGGGADAPADYFSSPEQQTEQAGDKQRRIAALDKLGAASRLRAAEIAPDPITASRADQVISSVGSGLTKAVGTVATMGPVAGAAAFGAAQADTRFHQEVDEGRDGGTALKLATADGVISALTAGLPAGGSTWLKTGAIAAVAGPVSFMANEQISKTILQNAGYSDAAAMHDPTDPVGLALSIALPTVMGGLHMHGVAKAKSLADVAMGLESGGRRTAPDGTLLTSPKGAQGEMQVMPATQNDPGFGVTPARDGSPEEIARVGVDYIAAMHARYGGDTAKTLAAYNAGPGRLDAAIAAHGDDWLAHMPEETKAYVAKGVKEYGEHTVVQAAADPDNVDAARVHLADAALNRYLPDHPDAMSELMRASDAVASGGVREATPDPLRTRLEANLGDIEVQRQQLLPIAGNIAEPGAIRVARQELKVHSSQVPDTSDAAVQVRAHEIQALAGGKNMLFKTAVKQAQQEVDQLGAGHTAKAQRLQSIIDSNANAARAAQQLARLDELHAQVSEQLQKVPLTSVQPAALHPVAAAARESLLRPDSVTIKAPEAAPKPKDLFSPRPAEMTPAGEPKPEPAPKPGESASKPPKSETPTATSATTEPPSLDVQRADATIAETPGLKVQLPGSEETMSAGEAMARARSEAEHDLGARELIRAALQCALTHGAS